MSAADFDLFADGTVAPARIPDGRGRPKGYSQTRGKEMADADLGDMDDGDDRTALAVRKVRAQTRDLEAKAALNELKLKIDSGQYLPRAAYREATATLLASLSQALRSLPDMLERKVSMSPDALQLVEAVIDETLNSAADKLMLFHGAEDGE